MFFFSKVRFFTIFVSNFTIHFRKTCYHQSYSNETGSVRDMRTDGFAADQDRVYISCETIQSAPLASMRSTTYGILCASPL